MNILIRNLPGDITEQALRDYLAPYGGADSIDITNAGNEDRASATIGVSYSAAVAEAVCEKIRHNHLDGHELVAEPVLFFS